MKARILFIGLDCLSPKLVQEWRGELPNLDRLMKGASWGPLRSVIPPVTIPAWMCMFTGKDPGRIGLYGFKKRKGFSYQEMELPHSGMVKEKTVWEILGAKGFKCAVLGVPPSYPPRRINGWLVSCFMTPSAESEFTYPKEFKKEALKASPGYRFDVDEFRTEKKKQALMQIYDMTESHFKLARHVLKEKKPDFFAMVEIGPDRIHHAFWKYFDREHRKYEKGNEFENAVKDYYKYLDGEVGRLVEIAGDGAHVFIASDHGAKRMKGCFCINEWLAEKGYLVFKKRPGKIADLGACEVDWAKTIAWAWGGYYSRIFLNVKGREAQGLVEKKDFEKTLESLRKEILAIRGPDGKTWKTIALRPSEAYKEVRGDVSDLMVFFDDLSWRAAGTVGHGKLYLDENDKGPDDAVHDWHGFFLWRKPGGGRKETRLENAGILDVAPTLLKACGMKANGMTGRVLE